MHTHTSSFWSFLDNCDTKHDVRKAPSSQIMHQPRETIALIAPPTGGRGDCYCLQLTETNVFPFNNWYGMRKNWCHTIVWGRNDLTPLTPPPPPTLTSTNTIDFFADTRFLRAPTHGVEFWSAVGLFLDSTSDVTNRCRSGSLF